MCQGCFPKIVKNVGGDGASSGGMRWQLWWADWLVFDSSSPKSVDRILVQLGIIGLGEWVFGEVFWGV